MMRDSWRGVTWRQSMAKSSLRSRDCDFVTLAWLPYMGSMEGSRARVSLMGHRARAFVRQLAKYIKRLIYLLAMLH